MAETRKERNIRKETQRRINAGDTSSYVQSQISSNPNTFTNVQPNQDISGGRRQAYEDMASVGIRGVSGRTTDDSDGKGSFDRGEKAREIQKDFLAARDPINYTPYEEQLYDDFGRFSDVPPEGRLTETAGDPLKQKIVSKDKVSPIQKFDNFMTSFGNVKFPTLPTPFGFGIEALKGFDSTNRFFKNLNTKKSGSLSNQDKITLINLVKAGGEGSGLQYLEKWAKDNDLSEEETRDLANKFTGEYSNIGSSISDSGIREYLDTKPEGFKDSVAAMLGQYRDEDNPGPNLEYVTDNLGTVGLEYLKATNPAAYYALRPAATSGQMEELAGMALTGNKDFDNKIFAAREVARERNNQGVGTGIPSIATALTPFTDVNNNGILDTLEVAQATTTPVTATTPVIGVPSLTPTTIDYASMGPQYGGYVNQGISDPRFASYFQNLNLFPRRS